jgi:HPt (histidine-containing phosphotransfer) domain-containing protein
VSTPDLNAPSQARGAEILAQVGEELAFVEAGKDTELLPINSPVMDFEEVSREGAPEVLAAGLAAIRALLDQVLDGTGKFTGESIRFLNEWHAWMSSVLTAWERGGQVPPVPAAWSQSAAPVAPAPAVNLRVAPSKTPAPQPVADEPAIRLNLAEDSELLTEFHSESLELLQTIEQGVLRLEENPTDARTINSIFRAFHTFKGGAGFLHLDALRDLAHDLESRLDAARRSELSITSEVIDLILAGGGRAQAVHRRDRRSASGRKTRRVHRRAHAGAAAAGPRHAGWGSSAHRSGRAAAKVCSPGFSRSGPPEGGTTSARTRACTCFTTVAHGQVLDERGQRLSREAQCRHRLRETRHPEAGQPRGSRG